MAQAFAVVLIVAVAGWAVWLLADGDAVDEALNKWEELEVLVIKAQS